MKMTKKAQRLIEDRIERAFRKHCNGVQIPIMSVVDVFKLGRAAIVEGVDDDELGKRIADYVSVIRVTKGPGR